MGLNGPVGKWIGEAAAILAAGAVITVMLTWRDVGANSTAITQLRSAEGTHAARMREDHDSIVQMKECIKGIKEDVDEIKKDIAAMERGQQEILREIKHGR